MAEKDSDVGYEENVITPEEFAELEKRETKGKLAGLVKKGKPEKTEKPAEPKEKMSVDSIVLKTEKLEGRIESLEAIRHAFDERFSRLSEEIGELRSSLLEKDKAFDRIDAGFRKVEDIVEEIQPSELRKELDRKSEGIVKNRAKIEALGMHIKEMSKSIKDFRDLLAKIKDVQNLVNISNEMTKTFTKVVEERRNVNKIAGKIETIFSELSKKVSEFDSYKDKVDFNAETMHDLMKSLDMLEVKLEDVLKREDMDKINDSMEKFETECKDDIQDIKDIVNMLVSSLKKTNLREVIEKQGIESVDSINDRLSQIQKRMEATESFMLGFESMGNDVEALKKGVGYLKKKLDELEKGAVQPAVAAEEKKVEEERRDVDALSEMVNYVRKCIDLGYTTKQVKKELLEKGWPRKTINEVILREIIRRRKQMRERDMKSEDQTLKDLKQMVKTPSITY